MRLTDLSELLLARLYELGNESPGAIFNADEICSEFGETNKVNVMHAVQALKNRGLVLASISLGPTSHAGINAEGRIFVESGSSAIIQRYQKQPDLYVNITGSPNAQVVVGSQNVTQTNTTANYQLAYAAIEEIRRATRNASLPAVVRSDALQDVATLEAQIQKQKPDSSIIEKSLQNLANIATIATAVVAAAPAIRAFLKI